MQAVEEPNFSPFEWHQDGGKTRNPLDSHSTGPENGGRSAEGIANLSLLDLSGAYAQLVSANVAHAAAGETARYYLERNGLILAAGSAMEIALLIDRAAMNLVLSPVRGDLDGDGSVTAVDMTLFIETLGGAYDGTQMPVIADLDADLSLDTSDFRILVENLGN